MGSRRRGEMGVGDVGGVWHRATESPSVIPTQIATMHASLPRWMAPSFHEVVVASTLQSCTPSCCSIASSNIPSPEKKGRPNIPQPNEPPVPMLLCPCELTCCHLRGRSAWGGQPALWMRVGRARCKPSHLKKRMLHHSAERRPHGQQKEKEHRAIANRTDRLKQLPHPNADRPSP